MKLKILLISSNPHRDLSLNEEYRAIEQAIQKTTYRNSIELIPKLATRIEDFIQALNEVKPHIVHFTGHGNSKGELIFTSDRGGSHAIPVNALKSLFKVTKDNIRLVFLDACYSKIQGEAIVSEIDFVIGMNTSIYETTATTFAQTFYNSFSSGRTIKEAFEQAKVMIEIKHSHEIDTPELLIKDKNNQDIRIKDIVGVEEEDLNKNKDSHTINQTHHSSGDIVGGDKITHNDSRVKIGGSNSGTIVIGNNNKMV